MTADFQAVDKASDNKLQISPAPAIPIDQGDAPGVPSPHFHLLARRPLFEVDRFRWSDVCEVLIDQAAHVFDALVDRIKNEASQGRGVNVVTSHRNGEGRKTILCCLARLLAAAGLKVVVADANFSNPALAQHLRLLPRAGWEEVLLRGVRPSRALIESLEDGVSLLPLCEPLAGDDIQRQAPRIASTLKRLRESHDVVLLEGGPLQACLAGRLPPEMIDAAVVVRDASTTSQSTVDAMALELSVYGIGDWRLVDNFQALSMHDVAGRQAAEKIVG